MIGLAWFFVIREGRPELEEILILCELLSLKPDFKHADVMVIQVGV